MTPDIEKIEHLLNAKAFGDLNAAERELVLAHLSGATEYEHMRETLLRVKKVFVAEAASLAADADLKEQILNRFEQNKAQHPSWQERVAGFFQTLIPTPAGRFAGALTVLLLLASAAFIVWPKQQPEMAQQLLPPATEPQIVTLMDNTPPPITLAVEKARRATPPAELSDLSSSTQPKPGTVSYDVLARTDQDEFIVAGFMEEKNLYQKEGNATEDLKLKSAEGDKIASDGQQAPPVYLNQEGLYQYQNSRVADAGNKGDGKYTDAYKNYTPVNNKKQENDGRALEKTAPVPQKPAAAANSEAFREEETIVATEGKQRKSTTAADATGGALYQDMSVASKIAPAAPVPVWPGVEGQTNPYTATLESVKAFFNKETGMAYRIGSQEYPKSKTVRLSLTFNAKGIITKVHVAGEVNEAQKKAFIQRALQLPAFRFTPGAGKPSLEQTYVLELY